MSQPRTEIVDCEEFGVIDVGVEKLLVGGVVTVDARIAERGYLNVSLAKGKVVFRADRYVGLIPIHDGLSVRVKPRASIANMTKMIVASGVAPSVIQDFSRGYLPQFEVTDRAETIYFESLVGGIEKIVRLGLMKSYVSPVSPPQWRGRLLVSETIKRHRSRGVHYRGEFDYKTLSTAAVENIALKTALALSLTWNEKHNPGAPAIGRARRLLALLDSIPIHDVNTATLASDIARSVQNLPSHFLYYRDPLWTAYLLLQRRLPGLATEGFVTFDSLVIDLSRVFESYVRRVLTDRAADRGWRVLDGNLMTLPLFSDGAAFRVQPDIVVSRDGKPVALLDATCLRTIVSRDLAT